MRLNAYERRKLKRQEKAKAARALVKAFRLQHKEISDFWTEERIKDAQIHELELNVPEEKE